MNKINIETIPHEEQRYQTCGDYWTDENGVEQFRVSDMQNPDYEFLVILHELVEQKLTGKRGIKGEDITKFDEEYEANRKEGDDSEPGDDPNSPYKKEHFFATNIERLMAEQLGVEWETYGDSVMNLYKGQTK